MIFKKRPPTRKVLFIFVTLFLLLLGSLVSWHLFLDESADTITVYDHPPSSEDIVLDTSKHCRMGDEIEYVYYEQVSMEQKQNNKFGLYIYAEQKEFFELAQNLVNSNGGDWGYVLIPYNVKDYDRDKWEGVFTRLHNKHLIPIIQLWDVDPEDYKVQTQRAARFLNSFMWPIEQRYVSVYNETNDAKFWRGRVAPAEYARVLDYTIAEFKAQNDNFFMLNGAFNVSAPSNVSHMDAFDYMYQMNKEVPGIFSKLDGWASHPYPQPNFSGSPYDTGRWSIRAYEDEIAYLKDTLGVTKDLPVFITETGWAHAEGETFNASFLGLVDVSRNLEIAFREVWLKDDRVKAVIPFTIWYEPPFDHFAWVNRDGVPYDHYNVVKELHKIAGTPNKMVSTKVRNLVCE